MTKELPPGWELATVGGVAHFVRGVTYSKEHAKNAPAPGLVGILRATNIGDGLNFDDLVFVPERFVSDEQIVRDGDVVIAMSSGSKSVVGKAAIARSPQRCGFGAFCGVIRPSQAITPSLLANYFQTKAYRNAVSEVSKGSNINNLKAGHILERPLPIPPAVEQRRIASKIDELFSRIDEGERVLERVSMLVERYRQSVLKAAVTGELTRAWREKNKDTPESGEVLLARILTARREAWEKAELQKMKVKGITPVNDNWKQRYQEPSPPDVSNLPKLPVGWAWASVAQIGSTFTGKTPPTSQSDLFGGGIPFLKPTDLDQGYEVRTCRQTLTEKGAAFCDLLPPMSILVTCIGATIGKVGLARVKCTTNQQINSLVVEPQLFDPRFVYWLFASPHGRKQVVGNSSSTTLPILNKSRFEALPMPIAPLSEQVCIVDAIEQRLNAALRMVKDVELERHRSNALRQSVLRAAFGGQLVPQDPANEPASALLERIAAERREEAAAPRRGRKKKKTA